MSRPFVTWKCAASLDGRVAAADGSSRWITSEEARADAHRLRAESDAVMVGSGTQRADDPQLTVRHVEVKQQPLRVVVDTSARISTRARVLDGAAPTLIAVADDAAAEHLLGRAEVVRLPRGVRGLDLEALMKVLQELGIRSVLLEGGPTLAGSFVAAGLVDRVVAYLAPILIGGSGLPALAPLLPPHEAGFVGFGGGGRRGASGRDPDRPSLSGLLRLRFDEVARIGPDLKLVATPLPPDDQAG